MKKTLKNVSLITTVLNERDNIEEFVESVINQTVLPREFIIVDGGSTDGTYEILKKYAKKYKWIKVFQIKGASIGRGRNHAIERAKGEIIACTDAGCILDKNWLKEITKPFFEKKNVDVVVGIYKPYYTNDFEYFQGLIIIKEPEKIFGNPSRMSIRSMAFRKMCWKKVGKLPEKYGGDDTLFNLKLKEIGCKFSYSKEAIVYWRMKKSYRDLMKQFCRYAIGDVRYGNIWKLKKNLLAEIILFLAFSGWICILFINFKVALFLLLFLFAIISLIKGCYCYFRSKKISSFWYCPSIFLVKNFSYFSGIALGMIKKIIK